MFTVIVVDDEPTALEHICTIMEMKCPQFKIVGTAENGEEGLEKVRQFRPDLVITDVKMPVMNGIEFVTQMKARFPDVDAIIVSGYTDFEYAKGAMKVGVSDFVLKPVSPNNLKNALNSVLEKLSQKLYQQRNKLIQRMSRGVTPPVWMLEKYFPSKSYYTAIVRKNGLPKRFSSAHGIEMFSDWMEMILVYGRDEMEALYICPEELVFSDGFENMMRHMMDKGKDEAGYVTAVISKNSFPVEMLPDKVKKLYRTLDKNTVVGYRQVLILENLMPMKQINEFGQEDLFQRIEYLIKEKQFHKLKKEIRIMMTAWGNEKRPQLWEESICRQILYLIQRYNSHLYENENEFMLEDAFFYATSTEELIDSFFFILSKNLNEENNALYSLDTPEFFESIHEYLRIHMREQITLQSVCKVFGVSQTYLSKLFRKYGGQSLNNYLISIRMEYAKMLIAEDHEILIRDVAARVGYNDQFYFT